MKSGAKVQTFLTSALRRVSQAKISMIFDKIKYVNRPEVTRNQSEPTTKPPGIENCENCVILVVSWLVLIGSWWVHGRFLKNKLEWFDWYLLFSSSFIKRESTRTHKEPTRISKSSHSQVFLEKSVLKICTKFTGEHPCRSAISVNLVFSCKFAEYFQNTFSTEHLWMATSWFRDSGWFLVGFDLFLVGSGGFTLYHLHQIKPFSGFTVGTNIIKVKDRA